MSDCLALRATACNLTGNRKLPKPNTGRQSCVGAKHEGQAHMASRDGSPSWLLLLQARESSIRPSSMKVLEMALVRDLSA